MTGKLYRDVIPSCEWRDKRTATSSQILNDTCSPWQHWPVVPLIDHRSHGHKPRSSVILPLTKSLSDKSNSIIYRPSANLLWMTVNTWLYLTGLLYPAVRYTPRFLYLHPHSTTLTRYEYREAKILFPPVPSRHPILDYIWFFSDTQNPVKLAPFVKC